MGTVVVERQAMQFFKHDIENVRVEQQQCSEERELCQVEDVVAVEVVVEVDAVKVKAVGRITGRDQGISEVAMTMEMTIEIGMMKKERRYSNLTLQENNTLIHVTR